MAVGGGSRHVGTRLVATCTAGAGGRAAAKAQDQKRARELFDVTEEPLLVQSFDMVPKSIEMLTNYNIPVPPRRLLEDLPWDQLEGLKDQLVREEIATTRAMLDKYERRHLLLSADMAKDILSKFGSWMCLRDIEVTLDTTPAGREAMDEALGEVSSSVASLEQKRDRVVTLLHSGQVSEARVLAERALLASDRLKELLAHILENIKQAREDQHEKMLNLIKLSGACAVVGIGCYHLGCAPSDSFSAETFQTLTGLAVAGTVMCLGFSAMSWFSSQECIDHYRRVRQAQTTRFTIARRLQETVDECIFGSVDVAAAADAAEPVLVKKDLEAAGLENERVAHIAAAETSGSDDDDADDEPEAVGHNVLAFN